ncbi:MAG: DUF4428 domain-containing protein [Clostridiales bacterium]|nr:DUF4428 domain-containing protein [Clostridiales bacterium]
MALFTKKEVCPVCGKKIKGDVVIKIKDNVPLCQACSSQINMDAAMIAEQTPEDIRKHLDYRRLNQDRVDRFVNTWDERVGTSLICVDESQRVWYCTRNKKDRNPPILNYDEVVSAVYLENNEPVEEEEKKGLLGGLFGGKKETKTLRSMKIHIELSNPYTRYVDVEAVPQNSVIKTGTVSYKSARRVLDRVMDMMLVMMKEKTGSVPDGEVSQTDANREETGAPAADAAQEERALLSKEESASGTETA